MGLLLLFTTAAATVLAQTKSEITAPPSASFQHRLDACSLLTTEEAETVTGHSLTSRIPSQKSEKGLTISQCYFLVGKSEDSIVLQVMTEDSNHSRKVKEFWEEMFHAEEETDRDEAKEKEHESLPPPQKIEALGDEAFWVSQRFGGVLHLLKGNIYLSVSIGGSGDALGKLQQSKKLAVMILERL